MLKENLVKLILRRVLRHTEKIDDDLYATSESLLISFSEKEYELLKKIVGK